jgi:8-oxo-dGTP pyrophosphatase MutT (NUDIX family)
MQGYWRLTRPLTMGAQAGVFRDGKEVLLVRHTYRPGWHFPGGGIEKNETAMTALKRELIEEAGVDLTDPPTLFGVFANFSNFPSDHVLFFIANGWQQPTVPEPNNEIAEVAFFPLDRLPADTTPAVHRRLTEISSNQPPSEHW